MGQSYYDSQSLHLLVFHEVQEIQEDQAYPKKIQQTNEVQLTQPTINEQLAVTLSAFNQTFS